MKIGACHTLNGTLVLTRSSFPSFTNLYIRYHRINQTSAGSNFNDVHGGNVKGINCQCAGDADAIEIRVYSGLPARCGIFIFDVRLKRASKSLNVFVEHFVWETTSIVAGLPTCEEEFVFAACFVFDFFK